MPILRFGQYKGTDIRDVPSEYLEYLVAQSQKTLAEMMAELERRAASEEDAMDWPERIVRAGYKALAMQNHPDRGGNTEDMKGLNAAKEQLSEMLKEYGYIES